jgi:hypothetical protein
MKSAIIDALADSVENDNVVCINGRTGRVLNSLTLLDYDEGLSGAKTWEAYKNQIYEESKAIIQSEIQKAKESPIDLLRNVGDYYEGGNCDIDPAMEKEFIELVKKEIDLNIDTYSDKLTEKERSQLKIECHAAIEI